MGAYYNEIEPFAVRWLENLIAAGHIAPGRVDSRSIREVRARDLRDVTQAHFFAGIAAWSHALRTAGWPDDLPVWTGSCPCQPFSSASRKSERRGFDDERHLWPAWFQLIKECRPPIVFGEQVASPDGLAWFDVVHANLEGASYAVAGVDLGAASVGGPHIRQRLYFVAIRDAFRLADDDDEGRGGKSDARVRRPEVHDVDGCGADGGVANPTLAGQQGHGSDRKHAAEQFPRTNSASGGVGDTDDERNAHKGFWADAEWIPCRDGKWRPAQPGAFPLAPRTPGCLGRLRAYGNSLCAPVATVFVRSVMDALGL